MRTPAALGLGGAAGVAGAGRRGQACGRRTTASSRCTLNRSAQPDPGGVAEAGWNPFRRREVTGSAYGDACRGVLRP